MIRMESLYRLDRWAATLAGLALLLMMLIGAANVVGTKLLGLPVPGTYELTETLMVASAFLAMALAHADNSHIRVELLIDRLPPRGRALADAFAQLCTAGFFAAIAWFGWSAALHSLRVGEFSSGSLPLPMWPARLALALGATLMVVQGVAHLARDARTLASPKTSTTHGPR